MDEPRDRERATGVPDEAGGDSSAGGRLRLKRLGRRLSQEQLAQASGVSRQAIAGVEAGRWTPSLKVAIAIARILDTSVEDLFGGDAELPVVEAVPVEPLVPTDPSERLALAVVGGRTVAFPLRSDAATDLGFRPASAVVEGSGVDGDGPGAVLDGSAIDADELTAGSLRARPVALLRPTVVVAGCDPALPLLAVALAHLDRPLDLLWWPCGSDTALELLRRGLVHVAGVHRAEAAGAGEVRLGDLDTATVGFADWREGLVVRPELAGEVHDLTDVARLGARLVNREEGSEARGLLEAERARLGVRAADLPGYDSRVSGHLPLASALAAGLGDAGVGSEPAALAYGLSFVPIALERYDLVVRQSDVASPEVQGLLQALGSSWLRSQLEVLPGYDAARCGVVSDTADAS